MSSISDEVDEEVEAEYDLESEEILDSILTISAVCRELVLPSIASEATASKKPVSS